MRSGSGALQSLDDLEATFRHKAGESYQGYVANISETCDDDNDVQLIVKAQVAPNNVDDAALLVEAMPDLVERTEVETMHTDGGYGSAEVDRLMNEHQVEQIQQRYLAPMGLRQLIFAIFFTHRPPSTSLAALFSTDNRTTHFFPPYLRRPRCRHPITCFSC